MRRHTIIVVLIILIANIGFCQKTDIISGTLSSSGINANKIASLVDSIELGAYPNRHSLLIFKDNKLVLEKYFVGKDERWGDDLGIRQHSDTSLHDLRSVSKSFVSACIGIAIAQGKIKSVDEKIFDFFKEYQQFRNEGREQLTIRHFLTMTSGIKWNETVPYNNPENSEVQMSLSPDPVKFVLSQPLIHAPGKVWNYNGGTTEILARIIEKATGKNVYAFAKEFLFAPLGITNSYWTSIPGTNTPAAASGLRLASRDALKFGILYLQNGKWQNRQIIPDLFVKESLTSHVGRPDGGGYGFQFWIITETLHGKAYTLSAAIGNGDQGIFIDSKNNMVVVMTAGNYNQWTIKNNSAAIMRKIYNALE
jgi:CubicO group peptidase (beta-lactamase class C family)